MTVEEIKQKLNLYTTSWQERAKMVYDFHEDRCKEHGRALKGGGPRKTGWNLRDTAALLGLSPVAIMQELKIYEHLLRHPDWFINCHNKTKALTIIDQRKTDGNERVRVEFKHGNKYVTGTIAHIPLEFEGTVWYVIKLSKQIDTEYIPIRYVCVQAYNIRIVHDRS